MSNDKKHKNDPLSKINEKRCHIVVDYTKRSRVVLVGFVSRLINVQKKPFLKMDME